MQDAEQLRALLAHTEDIVLVLDSGGQIGFVNAAVERVLGHDPEAMVGANAFEYVHPDERDRVVDAFESIVDAPEKTSDRLEHRARTVDGEWRWLESQVSNRTTSALEGYVISGRDVTERKRAEADHARARDLLVELAANTNDVLWTFTADWSELLFVNDAYEEIYGRSVESVRADPQGFLEAVHPEDRDQVTAAMERLSAGERVDIEYRVNEAEDYSRWVWVQGRPIVEDGEVTRVVGFSRDVTDRRERERQLHVLDRVLRHNLHNDMNVILGYAEQAANGMVDVETAMGHVVERGEQLLETADKEREIVELLCDNQGPGPVDLAAVLQESVERLRDRHPDADVTLTCEAEGPVSAVPSLRRAFDELLENAVVHAEKAPSVDVRTEADQRTATVQVADTGPAIPPQETEVLTSVDDIAPLYHGSGMGLWLVQWIVRLSGGDVSFRTGEEGNVVSVTLPLADGQGPTSSGTSSHT